MSEDFERIRQYFTDECQIIVIKRYDDNDGIYSGAITFWPVTEDARWQDTHRNLDFFKNHFALEADLLTEGFRHRRFTEVHPDFQSYVTHNILPIEWHNAMAELADRVVIFTKGNGHLLAEIPIEED